VADPGPGRMSGEVVRELTRVLDPGSVVTDPDVVEAYRRDHMVLAQPGVPCAVVRAASIGDVVATMQAASHRGVPVVTRGAGTGLSGGANAVDGAIVLSVAGMDAIIDIDVAARTAMVEPGVINGDLAAAVAAHGLWYVPDPASRAISSIGGNIATNAGGACCAKYGVTGDHVARITAVLADGTVIHTGATTRKNVAGYDLTRLLVGSEGTLAVIVEATVRLRSAPRAPSTLVATFGTMTDAGRAILAIGGVAEPSLLEVMDSTTIGAVERMTRMGLDTDAGALLIAQCDGADSVAEADAIARCCRRNGADFVARTTDPAEAEVFMHARRAALPALERLGSVLLDDVAVPQPALTDMVGRIEAIATRHGVTVGTFGHAGDGNLHPTIVFDPSDAGSSRRARAAFDDIVLAALALGGSITGEHGVGTLKEPYLDAMLGTQERALMARIKAAFDPQGILNPGKAI
jgi:glycolate oxidase